MKQRKEKLVSETDFEVAITLRLLTAMRLVIAHRRFGVKNMTEFANAIGEHSQNISKYENGTRTPTLNQCCRVCEQFNISPNWLFLGKGGMEEPGEIISAITELQQRMLSVEKHLELISNPKKKK